MHLLIKLQLNIAQKSNIKKLYSYQTENVKKLYLHLDTLMTKSIEQLNIHYQHITYTCKYYDFSIGRDLETLKKQEHWNIRKKQVEQQIV